MGYLDESTVHEETSGDVLFIYGATAAIPHKSSPLSGFCKGITSTQLVPWACEIESQQRIGNCIPL